MQCYNFIVFSIELGRFHLLDTSHINLSYLLRGHVDFSEMI